MKVGHEFAAASGNAKGDCHWLGIRFDAGRGFSPTDGESWIGQSTDDACHSLMSQRGWMTGLWRTTEQLREPDAHPAVVALRAAGDRGDFSFSSRIEAADSGGRAV